MSKPQFTPGPWEATDLDHPDYFPSVFIGPELVYEDGSGRFRDSITVNCGPPPDDIARGKGIGTTMETANANARLIAAAPALYEALKAIDAGFADGSIQFSKKRQADSDPYHPANTLMCAALALVDGKAGSPTGEEPRFCPQCDYKGVCTTCPKCIVPTIAESEAL